jgi:hypothetical protein
VRHRKRSHGAAGRGPAWLRRLTGGQEIGGSNPPVPTNGQLAFAGLGLDTSRFITPRQWSDAQLKRAVTAARSADELLHSLGLPPGSDAAWTRVKANAIRLGLDLSQLERISEPADPQPDLSNLRQAATALAACWFSLCGFNTAIPVEPAVYDLLISGSDGIKRVQVKTTTHKSKNGWMIQVGRRPRSSPAGSLFFCGHILSTSWEMPPGLWRRRMRHEKQTIAFGVGWALGGTISVETPGNTALGDGSGGAWC